MVLLFLSSRNSDRDYNVLFCVHTFQKCDTILTELWAHDDSYPFVRPVDKRQVTQYCYCYSFVSPWLGLACLASPYADNICHVSHALTVLCETELIFSTCATCKTCVELVDTGFFEATYPILIYMYDDCESHVFELRIETKFEVWDSRTFLM